MNKIVSSGKNDTGDAFRRYFFSGAFGMDYLKIFVFSISSAAVLFLLAKIMGNKQLSQLNLFDYITGITIGSLAAEMATGLDQDPFQSILAMAVYAGLDCVLSVITEKSIKARRVIVGQPRVLLHEGKLYRENLKKAKLEINDFLTLCRINGYFSLDEIETAVLEFNGNISFLPSVKSRPVTPEDLSLSPRQQKPMFNVIMDGKVMEENLASAGKDREWLKKQLHAQGFADENDVFLATCDGENFYAYRMIQKEKQTPWFV